MEKPSKAQRIFKEERIRWLSSVRWLSL